MQLLDRTDSHLSVENIANSERICVLQEQISKLEDQLKTSREECTLTKQEMRKTSLALWKKVFFKVYTFHENLCIFYL